MDTGPVCPSVPRRRKQERDRVLRARSTQKRMSSEAATKHAHVTTRNTTGHTSCQEGGTQERAGSVPCSLLGNRAENPATGGKARNGGSGGGGTSTLGDTKSEKGRTRDTLRPVSAVKGCEVLLGVGSVGPHVHLPSFSLWKINILIDPGKIIEPGVVISLSARGINVQIHSQTPAFLITKTKRLSQVWFTKRTKLTSLPSAWAVLVPAQ